MNNNSCLIEELRKLKESSKEAVENLDSFSDFKEYMHIKRHVQDELLDLLIKANESSKAELILVCGGVGDGKSHLISYLIEKRPDILDNFKKHNDATESFEPQETSIDTLNKVLDDFSDESLSKGSSSKLILAINLGALNNFIDSEYKDRFTKLRQYVTEAGILEAAVSDNAYDSESNFQHINFSDYHMFSLTKDGAKSNYIRELINKITNNVDENPFYNSYESGCLSCGHGEKCPVKANYEFLMGDGVKEEVISLLIEAMIKEKLIISTRSLLNFMYDILVSNYIDNAVAESLQNVIGDMEFSNYIEHLTPNLLFEHRDLSNIFEVVSKLDPVNNRKEELDNLIIKFNITENLSGLFNNHIEMPETWYARGVIQDAEKLNQIIENTKNFKDKLIKFFVRMYRFSPKDSYINLRDELYLDYVMNLYYWNKGSKAELKKLYDDVKEAIYKWNGESESESINLFVGKNQTKYRISQKLDIASHVGELQMREEVQLDKFSPALMLEYKRKGGNEAYGISIDFSLYKLLMKVRDGYRPNKKDKNNYVNFVEFMDRILGLGGQSKELIFEEKSGFGGNSKRYKLSYDDEFEYYSFVEM
jgi:DNA phosphorothioation-dependent restriction protein DptF